MGLRGGLTRFAVFLFDERVFWPWREAVMLAHQAHAFHGIQDEGFANSRVFGPIGKFLKDLFHGLLFFAFEFLFEELQSPGVEMTAVEAGSVQDHGAEEFLFGFGEFRVLVGTIHSELGGFVGDDVEEMFGKVIADGVGEGAGFVGEVGIGFGVHKRVIS